MKYVDQLDAVGRAAMEIGVEAGMQKISDMFVAALALEGYGEERLVRLAQRVSELDTEFDGAYGCGPEADWLQVRHALRSVPRTKPAHPRVQLQKGINPAQEKMMWTFGAA